jgi:peptide/nickel transport system substrate-binding protein
MNSYQQLQQQLTQGRIGRREFIQRLTMLGMAAAIPSALSLSAQAAPRRGGHLRVGSSQGSTTDSMNFSLLTSGFTRLFFSGFMNRLTEVNTTNALVPGLSTGWESNTGATEWTFELRNDVEFHNGKSFTADDAIASINVHRGEESTSAVKSLAAQIEGITKSGKHTVTVKLKEGNADFAFLLSDAAFGIAPVKADGTLEYGIGSGAYMVERFDPGLVAELKRFPNYHKSDQGWFDSVDIRVVADTTARQNALRTGELDIIDQIDLKTAHLLSKTDGIEVLDVAGPLHATFPMNTGVAPFDNNDVRMALKYAIDRDEIVSQVLRGHGTAGNDHPLSPSYRYFHSELPQRKYDPDKAKFHLNKAGLDKLEVELSSSDVIFNGAMDVVLLYKEHAAKAGINIIPNRVPQDGYWSDVWMKAPWCASYWYGQPTEDWILTVAYAETSNWNETYWKHAQFNGLLKAARVELDESKRRQMYWDMQEMIRDEGGAVVPSFSNHVMAYTSKLKHAAAVNGTGDFDGYAMLDRWWFEG